MMTVDDLRMVVGDITATTKAYVREVVADVQALYGAQIKALEDRIATVQTTPGPQGERGERGADGIGIPGPKGDTGERGADGIAGKDAVLPDLDVLAQKAAAYVPKSLDGVHGRDGSSMTTGIGAPVFEAKSGDVYLDAATGDVYSWR